MLKFNEHLRKLTTILYIASGPVFFLKNTFLSWLWLLAPKRVSDVGIAYLSFYILLLVAEVGFCLFCFASSCSTDPSVSTGYLILALNFLRDENGTMRFEELTKVHIICCVSLSVIYRATRDCSRSKNNNSISMDLQFWGLYPAWFDVINFICYIEAKPHSLVREILSVINRTNY